MVIPTVSVSQADGVTLKAMVATAEGPPTARAAGRPRPGSVFSKDPSRIAGAGKGGRPLLYTPNPLVERIVRVALGCPGAFPKPMLMEPNINNDLTTTVVPPLDLTKPCSSTSVGSARRGPGVARACSAERDSTSHGNLDGPPFFAGGLGISQSEQPLQPVCIPLPLLLRLAAQARRSMRKLLSDPDRARQWATAVALAALAAALQWAGQAWVGNRIPYLFFMAAIVFAAARGRSNRRPAGGRGRSSSTPWRGYIRQAGSGWRARSTRSRCWSTPCWPRCWRRWARACA